MFINKISFTPLPQTQQVVKHRKQPEKSSLQYSKEENNKTSHAVLSLIPSSGAANFHITQAPNVNLERPTQMLKNPSELPRSATPEKNLTYELATMKTERKAAKVLGIVSATFVICWLPFFSLNLTYGICSSCRVNKIIAKLCLWLGYLSSTVNPIIYTVFNHTFRITLLRILTCKFKTMPNRNLGDSITTSNNSII